MTIASERLAAILKAEHSLGNQFGKVVREIREQCLHDVAEALAEELKLYDPRFDMEGFIDRCNNK